MTYEPTHLELWTLPDSYFGKEWSDYYVFLGQHRDSDSLSRSNFQCGLEAIKGEADDDVMVIRESHWAVGWVEWIAIRKTNYSALKTADEIMAALADYPVVDETHWSEMEYTEAAEYWGRMSVSERIDWCQWCNISVFAARHDDLPEDESGDLVRRLGE